MYFKLYVQTRKSNRFVCKFIVKGASMLEAVDYATEYLVAPELYIAECAICDEAEIKEYDLVYPTEEWVNLNIKRFMEN